MSVRVRASFVVFATAALALAVWLVVSSGDAGRGEIPKELAVSPAGWETDFSKHSVPLGEIRSGGPPRDGIPPIDQPRFTSTKQADRFLEGREPVIKVESGGKVRAYPLQILIWHEIVNDEIAGVPVAVTFCPLCNATRVFDRRFEGKTLRFGTTGNLRRSDLVMWDDRTESWWQQFSGEAIVGELTGSKLDVLDSQILAWADFKQRYPLSAVLARPRNHDRPYGNNPYVGYDDVDSSPFALGEQPDGRLLPKERVSSVSVDDEHVVVPLERLAKRRLAQFSVADTPVVSVYKSGVASALDTETIGAGRDTGTAAAFDRRVGGKTLSFRPIGDGRFADETTGSRWNFEGVSTAGPLKGKQLKPVAHDEEFWFAVAAFVPGARVIGGSSGS